jgi:hypothetical protein
MSFYYQNYLDMLELSVKDFEIYKNNLNKRKKSFIIESKRTSKFIVINGKKVARLKSRNTIDTLDKSESKKVINLFAVVKKNVNSFLTRNDYHVEPIEKIYSSSFSNRPLFDSMPVGTQFHYVDVKHCYWRIAFLLGYISERLYTRVVANPDLKLWRNMALACIIGSKEVEYYENGEIRHTVQEDNRLHNIVYSNMRHFAWNLFGKLAFEKIGKDNCLGYFTDGIMVFDTDVRIIQSTLARHQLQHRIVLCEKTGHREYVFVDEGVIRRF